MHAEFTVRGFCHSRLYLNAFIKQDYCDPAMPEDQGIRYHSWLTALFLRCFGMITDLKLANGKVIYLNKSDFDKWKREKASADVYREHHGFEEVSLRIDVACAAQYAKIADRLLDYTKTQPHCDLPRGVELLEKAAKLEKAANFEQNRQINGNYYTQRVEINARLRDIFNHYTTPKPDRIQASIKTFQESIVTLTKAHKQTQESTSHQLVSANEQIESLKRISAIVGRDLGQNLFSQNDVSELHQQLSKEWYAKLAEKINNPLYLASERAVVQEDEECEQKIRSYDHTHNIHPECFGAYELQKLRSLARLERIVTIFNPELLRQIYESGLENDKKMIQAKVSEFEKEANENIKQGPMHFQTAIWKLKEAEKTCLEGDRKQIATRREKLERLYAWQTANVDLGITDNRSISMGLESDLQTWLAERDDKSKSAHEVQKTARAVASAFKKFVETQDSFAKAYDILNQDLAPHKDLLRNFNFTMESLKNSELEAISSGWSRDVDAEVIEPLRRHVALLAISEYSDKLRKSFATYQETARHADEINDRLNSHFENGDLDGANKTLLEVQQEMKEAPVVCEHYEKIQFPVSKFLKWKQKLEQENKQVHERMVQFLQLSPADRMKEIQKMQKELTACSEAQANWYKDLTEPKKEFLDALKFISDWIKRIAERMVKHPDKLSIFESDPMWDWIHNQLPLHELYKLGPYQKPDPDKYYRYKAKAVSSFDFVGWKEKNSALDYPFVMPKKLEQLQNDLRLAYYFAQLNALIKTFYDESPYLLNKLEPFFTQVKNLAEVRKENKFSHNIRYNFDTEEVALALIGLEMAFYKERENYLHIIHPRPRDNQNNAPSVKVIECIYGICRELGMTEGGALRLKNQPPMLVEGKPEIQFAKNHYDEFLDSWGRWQALDDEKKKNQEGYELMFTVVANFLTMWRSTIPNIKPN